MSLILKPHEEAHELSILIDNDKNLSHNDKFTQFLIKSCTKKFEIFEFFNTPEIVAELQRSAATHSGPGRKRA